MAFQAEEQILKDKSQLSKESEFKSVPDLTSADVVFKSMEPSSTAT